MKIFTSTLLILATVAIGYIIMGVVEGPGGPANNIQELMEDPDHEDHYI